MINYRWKESPNHFFPNFYPLMRSLSCPRVKEVRRDFTVRLKFQKRSELKFVSHSESHILEA